jgi:hypothetical protein
MEKAEMQRNFPIFMCTFSPLYRSGEGEGDGGRGRSITCTDQKRCGFEKIHKPVFHRLHWKLR